MQLWKTLSQKIILKYSRFLTVESHTIQLPDGTIISDWPWLITPNYVNVVAVTKNQSFLCFRQTKYSIDGTSLAPVGGYIESNEAPLVAAQRELLEETGHQAKDWTFLGKYSVDGNRGAGIAYLYLARDAYPAAEIKVDDLEEQELLYLSHIEIEQALKENEFKVLPWATVVALALNHINQQDQ